MVGFNRRFSEYAQKAKKYIIERINPLFMHYRMNAGHFPLDHWIHGEEGGGRIIGEACHIIDLFSFFTESKVRSIATGSLTSRTKSLSSLDNRVIIFEYEDGSIATLEYFAIGSREFPKEYMEIHFDEKTIVIDDYKSMIGYGLKIPEIKTSESEKGHLQELIALSHHLKDEKNKKNYWPISILDMVETTEITLAISMAVFQVGA